MGCVQCQPGSKEKYTPESPTLLSTAHVACSTTSARGQGCWSPWSIAPATTKIRIVRVDRLPAAAPAEDELERHAQRRAARSLLRSVLRRRCKEAGRCPEETEGAERKGLGDVEATGDQVAVDAWL